MRTLHYYLIWVILGLAISTGLYFVGGLYRQHLEQQDIARLATDFPVRIGDVKGRRLSLQLAYASYLQRHRRYDEALEILGRLLDKGEGSQQLTVFYNLGNLYLSRALDSIAAAQIDQATVLTGLAKNAYRRALAIDSRHWDAKYNLDVAMRLLPEMDRVNIVDEPEQNKKSKPWTTVPGFPRGLP